ncbi:MAG: bifunctional tetrahydrofolate synthase/dihydrofolate synthase [Pseudomonadota bacterium]
MAEGPELQAWLKKLHHFSRTEIELGLDRVNAVLDRLSLSLPSTVLTVGGTNGKGSTVACLSAVLAECGHACGVYTSPHLQRYNERVRLHGSLASDAQLIDSFEAVDAARGDTPLTYFEFGTLAALQCFSNASLDTLILEVGLGGRLDAVNAVEPTACLITNVALDHCDWLGDSIALIAREKAGIMRAGKPVVFAGADVPDIIVEHAAELGADLRIAGRDYRWARLDNGQWRFEGRGNTLDGLSPPALEGDFQIANAAGALALLDSIGLSLDRVGVDRGLRAMSLPGRMQRHGNWLFDVAHNPAAATELAQTLQQAAEPGRRVALVGMLDDKDVAGVLAALAPVVDHWVVAPAVSPRALSVDVLADRIATVSDAVITRAADIEDAVQHARDAGGDTTLVTGSFFVVGPVQQALGL